MGINIRTSPGSPLVSPDRDIRYLYPQIVKLVAGKFNNKSWPELFSMLEEVGGEWDKLCDAHDAYVEFLNKSCDNPEQNLQEVLTECGWFQLPQYAQVLYCAMLGQVMTCQLFHAMRDTTHLGEKPDGVTELSKAARSTQNEPSVA